MAKEGISKLKVWIGITFLLYLLDLQILSTLSFIYIIYIAYIYKKRVFNINNSKSFYSPISGVVVSMYQKDNNWYIVVEKSLLDNALLYMPIDNHLKYSINKKGAILNSNNFKAHNINSHLSLVFDDFSLQILSSSFALKNYSYYNDDTYITQATPIGSCGSSSATIKIKKGFKPNVKIAQKLKALTTNLGTIYE